MPLRACIQNYTLYGFQNKEIKVILWNTITMFSNYMYCLIRSHFEYFFLTFDKIMGFIVFSCVRKVTAPFK